MLNKINKVLTGDILKVLCDMGHDDVLILADANFPGEAIARSTTYGKLIRMSASDASTMYEAIHELFPIDVGYTKEPVCVMDLTDGDKAKGMKQPEVWDEFERILHKDHPDTNLGKIERFAFYEKAKKAYAVIQTGESRQYGNLLLVKGVVL
ncbi:MAG: fucose isomerase [Clostridia bacterium]|nr:fucose isomerase [Clostridia bacterium]